MPPMTLPQQIKNAIETYRDSQHLPSTERLEWVRAVDHALATGDESIISNTSIWVEWVPAVYQELKNDSKISFVDEKDRP